jgi:uncharacterized protein YlaI
MMKCAGCGRDVMPNESMDRVQEHVENGPTKTYMGCPDCVSRVNGTPKAPAAQSYGTFQPGEYLCGICKGHFHENSVPQLQARLHPDDVAGTDVKPGHYVCCGNCQEKFKAKIAARLAASDPGFHAHCLRASGVAPGKVMDLQADPAALKAQFAATVKDPAAFCEGNWLV